MFFKAAWPSAAQLDDLVRRFQECRVGKTEWTHAAHLCVGTWHVAHFGEAEALDRLRSGIQRLNISLGGTNTDTAGYHETITRAYVRLLGDYLQRYPHAKVVTAVQRLLAGPLAANDVLLQFYSQERLTSVAARLGPVEPDLRPISAEITERFLSGGASTSHEFRRPIGLSHRTTRQELTDDRLDVENRGAVDSVQPTHLQSPAVAAHRLDDGAAETIRPRFRPLRQDTDFRPGVIPPRMPRAGDDSGHRHAIEVEDHFGMRKPVDAVERVDGQRAVDHDLRLDPPQSSSSTSARRLRTTPIGSSVIISASAADQARRLISMVETDVKNSRRTVSACGGSLVSSRARVMSSSQRCRAAGVIANGM